MMFYLLLKSMSSLLASLDGRVTRSARRAAEAAAEGSAKKVKTNSTPRKHVPDPILARPPVKLETRLIRLQSPEQLDLAVQLVNTIREDRPHMAAKLSKLLPYHQSDLSRRVWHASVISERTHVWAVRELRDNALVGVIWFERNMQKFGDKMQVVGSIDVLWVSPAFRKFGLGSSLVQGIFLRYPAVEVWTAFASQAAKDFGLHRFWKKNGFTESAAEVGKTSLDGFFVRTAATALHCRLAKRRSGIHIKESPYQEDAKDLVPSEFVEYHNELMSLSKNGVLGNDCGGGCFCPPGEDEIWRKAIVGVVEDWLPKKSFLSEFKWWLGLLDKRPVLSYENGGIICNDFLKFRQENEPEVQVLAGFKIAFKSDKLNGIISAKGSKYSLVSLGGEAARIRDCGEINKPVNVNFELAGVWFPNSKSVDRKLLVFYIALQKTGVAIRKGDELVCASS